MGCFSPRRYGTNGCIPAVVNSTVGSFSGMSDAESMCACPLSSKNLTKASLNCWASMCSSLIIPRMWYLFKYNSTCGRRYFQKSSERIFSMSLSDMITLFPSDFSIFNGAEPISLTTTVSQSFSSEIISLMWSLWD